MKLVVMICLILIAFTGCTSKKIRNQINDEITKTPAAKTNDELFSQEEEMLTNDQHLSDEQKNNLKSLLTKMKVQNSSIDDEIMKTKAILFKALIDKKYSKLKLNILENQLIKLNRKKTRYSLSAYREARNILGKAEVPLEKTLRMIDNRTIYDF